MSNIDFDIPRNLNVNDNLNNLELLYGNMRHIDTNTREIHSHLDRLYENSFKILNNESDKKNI